MKFITYFHLNLIYLGRPFHGVVFVERQVEDPVFVLKNLC
jgi:hypothetical protein